MAVGLSISVRISWADGQNRGGVLPGPAKAPAIKGSAGPRAVEGPWRSQRSQGRRRCDLHADGPGVDSQWVADRMDAMGLSRDPVACRRDCFREDRPPTASRDRWVPHASGPELSHTRKPDRRPSVSALQRPRTPRRRPPVMPSDGQTALTTGPDRRATRWLMPRLNGPPDNIAPKGARRMPRGGPPSFLEYRRRKSRSGPTGDRNQRRPDRP